MATATISIVELAHKWELLQNGLTFSKKVDFKLFEEVFTATYDLLSKSAPDGKIDKTQLSLILSVHLFSSSSEKGLDYKSRAALILTDRMLNCFIYHDSFGTADELPIFILETRKEIRISFKKVNESIFTLAKLLEDDYWNN
ncbi:MAG: hypothetical protein J6Q72_06915 [Clostridia bacterium]|nr:hypothetical protein [Clostridia bacterium]